MALMKDMVNAGVQSHRAYSTNGTVSTGLSAATGGQGSATLMPSAINVVSTVASSSGVILPPACRKGDQLVIRNAQATNALLVFPPVGGVVNELATNASFSVAAAKTVAVYCVSDDGLTWIADLSA